MHFHSRYDQLPAPSDCQAAKIGHERWLEAMDAEADPGIAAFGRDVAADPAGRKLLDAIFGNSPHLTHCVLKEPGFLREIVTDGPDATMARLLEGLRPTAAQAGDAGMASLMRDLRVGKRRAALLIAVADIAGLWSLDQVTGALSAFADTALGRAAAHLLAEAGRTGQIEIRNGADPAKGSGYVVIGMGKLGASELNYSSDIDLIVLYDDERIVYTGQRTMQDAMVRLTQGVVRMMEERTADGYVFRCDLRLRPDPNATPVAISTLAAETYYESLGQNWERAAMIKARAVAGDFESGEEFLKTLVPYVWRKHLDFAAIQDIHSIKRQINVHRGSGTIKVAGHDVKLGRGGIREIEFFAQTQQLIWGGRNPSLRSRRTCDAISALAAAGRVAESTAGEMIEAYRYLRRVEHRLQMIDDQQTHTIPEEGPELDRLAIFLGYPRTDALAQDLLERLRTVERHYAALFEEAPALAGPGNLVFTGTEPDPETLETITKLGFENAETVSAVIMGWHHGRYGATRSVRAREILTELVPALLQALGRTAQPDQAFMKFDEFLSRLPAGVQLFSLFQANPALLDLVAEIMGNAPSLADLLARRPILLDGVLSRDFFDPMPDRDTLESELREATKNAGSFEEILDIARRWAGDRKFRVGVQLLRNLLKADAAGPIFTDIADAAIRILLPAVEREFAAQHGRIEGGGMVVLAFGNLGGRELTVGSDLDLVFVYDMAADAEASDGPRPLSPHDYFARLSRRLVNAISAQTAEGILFEVDLRLRPSGGSGPVASSLEAFSRYQRESAWTWEHMALTRARAVAGPERLAGRIAEVVREVLTRKRDPGKLAADVAEMRLRMAREHGTRSHFDIKHMRGGLIDCEFIAQYLQLLHAHDHPEVLSGNTAQALERSETAGLIPAATGDDLLGAVRLWQRVRGIIRLCYRQGFDPDTATPGAKRVLADAAQAASFADLEKKIRETADSVRGYFHTMIEVPAGFGPDGEKKEATE